VNGVVYEAYMVARIDVILLFPYRMTSILFTAVYIRPRGGDPNTEHRGCTQYARRGGKKNIKVDVGNTCLIPEVSWKTPLKLFRRL
jgi:hypothetical protein